MNTANSKFDALVTNLGLRKPDYIAKDTCECGWAIGQYVLRACLTRCPICSAVTWCVWVQEAVRWRDDNDRYRANTFWHYYLKVDDSDSFQYLCHRIETELPERLTTLEKDLRDIARGKVTP